jgi:ATP-binding cassette subfamily F protein 3
MPEAPEAKVRARVGAIGFSGLTGNTKVEKLSGGEKARLLLGLATFNAPHLVVLDEPTNHLDIDSRAALIEAINDFSGAVILVSHDRHLLDACADRLWLVQDGAVHPFVGDLDDYRLRVLNGSGTQAPPANKPAARPDPAAARRAAADKRAATAPLRKRVTEAETELAHLTRQLRKLDATLADGDLFSRDPGRAAALSKTRTNVVDAIAKAEEEWLAASEALQTA